MVDLHKCLLNLESDKRMNNIYQQQGRLDDADVQKRLLELPDLAEQAEELRLEDEGEYTNGSH